MLNLKLVNSRDNALGLAIVRGFEKDPEGTLATIREYYQTNPKALIETIGSTNAMALGLQTQLERFRYYFPYKRYQSGLHGLIFPFKTLPEVIAALKCAKSLIGDLHLNLEARSISRTNAMAREKPFHNLYIDQL